MGLKLLAAMTVTAMLPGAAPGRIELLQVRAVRHWAAGEATRIAIEVNGEFTYHSERLHNPERIFFDVFKSRPVISSKKFLNRELEDRILKRIRVAETLPGVTRIVLDLRSDAESSASQLTNPNRLVIELRPSRSAPGQTAPPQPLPTSAASASSPAGVVIRPGIPRVEEGPAAAAAIRDRAGPAVAPLPSSAEPSRAQSGAKPSAEGPQERPAASATQPKAAPSAVRQPAEPADARLQSQMTAEPSRTQTGAKPAVRPAQEKPAAAAVPPKPATETDDSAAALVRTDPAKAARRTSNGQNSLIRALGLKLTRVVLDPGHGGHDQGTMGPKGLLEKALVLDIAQRLGKLIETRMGAEVVYTRTDDTFVPLERRTAIANEKKADLFLSIHANSSSIPRISGVETYYLNFTNSKEALDVASRENASSEKSIFELRDIIQKITLHEKTEESREFAGRIQSALYTFSARALPGSRNRGVKKAPFVVLIGASMPSVLAEIGFLSNAREEALLKKSDHRDKLAEALYRGLSRYAEGLSHFQMAARE